MMNFLKQFLENIEKYVCVVTFVVMLTLAFVNVVSRFVMHMSLSFSEEIVTGLFVLASLAGSSLAVRDRSHLGLDFITSFMPQKTQGMLLIIASCLGIFFCLVIFYFGALMVHQEFITKQVSATMQWPEWIYGLTVPVGCGLLILRYIVTIWEQTSALKKGDVVR